MRYGDGNVWVLWLGDFKAEWSVPRRDFSRREVGLLLTRTDQGNNKEMERFAYQRIGVCAWTIHDTKVEEDMQRLPWSNVELQLH